MNLTIVEQSTSSIENFDFINYDLDDYCKYFKSVPYNFVQRKSRDSFSSEYKLFYFELFWT